MNPTQFGNALKHETTQVFVAVVAALGFMWKEGVPMELLLAIAHAGVWLIAGEKLRSAVVGGVKAWRAKGDGASG